GRRTPRRAAPPPTGLLSRPGATKPREGGRPWTRTAARPSRGTAGPRSLSAAGSRRGWWPTGTSRARPTRPSRASSWGPGARTPADEPLGARLQPVGEALRARPGLPAGQGLLVAAVRDDGPSALAGLRQNDVLVALADKPLASADDLAKQLKAAGEAA